MSYQWRKALANAALVFIGCILSKIPAGETMSLDWQMLKHTLVACGTITLFAELRYIYAFLSQWGDTPPTPPVINNNGGTGGIPIPALATKG